MAPSVRHDVDQMQPNVLRRSLEEIRGRSVKARIDPNPSIETDEREMLALINRTRIAVGMSQKAMAITAGCSESELSDAINGKAGRRFDAEWLWRQDDLFLGKFIELLSDARQLTAENQREARKARALELIGLLFDVA